MPDAKQASIGAAPGKLTMDDIVFLIRQSPDWASLATDYEAGRHVEHRRYKPDDSIPGFPRRVEHLIGRWNRLFELNFFRCRQILKDIALGTVRAVPGAQVLTEQDYLRQAQDLAKTDALLFYMDDDDLFAPDMRERLAGLDMSAIDMAVFPLVRIGQTISTFVRAGEAATRVVGTRKDFDFRFQTNNYAIRTLRVSPTHVPNLKDHVLASAYADRNGLRDAYFDRLLSATNKTPCSASGLPALLRDATRTVGTIRHYVDAVRNAPIPASEFWLRQAMEQTASLFERLARSARPNVRFGLADNLMLRFGWAASSSTVARLRR